MVDHNRFRLGVGMVVCNRQGKVLWAKRQRRDSWQFPQGGISENETLEAAVYRELEEEVGLKEQDVQILGQTKEWLGYEWPEEMRLTHKDPNRLGQKHKWFLLRLTAEDTAIRLDNVDPPEFVKWEWVDYFYPVEHVVDFKKEVYQKALNELAVYINN